MSTMATEVKATTMEQRMKALLADSDWTIQGKSIINPDVQELFHQGINHEDLRRTILNDSRWELLNERQKAFILSEVDLVGCPVRVGDTIEILTDRPQSAALRRGELQKVARGRTEGPAGVVTEDGWVVWDANYRLVTSLEFPQPLLPFSEDDVRPVLVQTRAEQRVGTFVMHTGSDGGWNDDCAVVMQGVDRAARHFTDNGIRGGWGSTPEGKRYLGEVVRWMRATLVARWMDSQPYEAPMVEALREPEPIPERDLTPVDRAATVGELALRLDEMSARITQMTRDMERLTAENRALREWQTSAIEDAEKFCNALSEIAERRELCSEFEESIDSANRVTSVLQFESTRTRSVEVYVRGTATVNWSTSVTIERSRSDADSDVEQRAQEMIENDYSARDLVREYGDMYDVTIEIDETEIQ